MFRKSLQAKLERIFQLNKVRYDLPAEDAKEQECVFIDVKKVVSKVKHKKATCRVEGMVSIFANSDKFPFGYVMKKINSADPSDTKDIFFYNIEENAKYFGNLAERRFGFTYFYQTEYDPDDGTMSSVVFE